MLWKYDTNLSNVISSCVPYVNVNSSRALYDIYNTNHSTFHRDFHMSKIIPNPNIIIQKRPGSAMW